ncbi:response regulator [Planctomyces sp. SH-PL14]|uniref:response regulator n=1 Tax=Planctomyces sp. SH-PL14 TaxID=1632864 RepID=UPI00078EA1C2|nr:response regulator [Planctomyces sp. SH-PL14]AMV20817.1 Alkaline phosphatase synthesis sensor protein PhoR [Planctomyces sp. SH-PL14]
MGSDTPRILVVDDNPATLYSTTRILRGAGFAVTEAETGQDAYRRALEGVDLVVLDVNLPDIDGFTVCRMLRENPTTAHLPIVHLSATFVTTSHKVTGLESGADGYLTHPIEPPVLVATVNAFLRARRAESERRASDERFRAIFENALNGVAILDDRLVCRDANPALCGLLLVDREALIGRVVTDFVAEERQGEIAAIRHELSENLAWRGTLPLRRSDGTPVYLECSLSQYHEPGLRLAIVNDVTDRLRHEQEREELLASERAARGEAERANRLKDDFLATLSHELRTPLNAIVGWSQLLRMGSSTPAELNEGLEAIERNSHAQSQMIADLLDISRITSGKIRLDVEAIDPAAFVEAALSAVRPAADAKEIRLIQTLSAAAGPILGDPSRLQQVLWNLVNNAVKFTPRGGRVQVSVRRVNSHVEIRVADNGRGIEKTLLPLVFERFRQGDGTSTREHGGLGLGLAIARQIVEMHGGTIEAESEGDGKGATFIVRVPVSSVRLSQPHEESAAGEPAAADSPAAPEAPTVGAGWRVDLSGIRVLLVEDDDDSRAMVKRVLTGRGAEVREVASVNAALEAIEPFRPHILISDLGMPGRDGLDLIRDIRRRGVTYQSLPAIALTAFARLEDRRRALLAGFQVHLTKPVDPHELTAVTASLTGRTGGHLRPPQPPAPPST